MTTTTTTTTTKFETFEQYLQMSHARDYTGSDDNMPDDFNDWVLNDIDIYERLLDYLDDCIQYNEESEESHTDFELLTQKLQSAADFTSEL